MSEAVRHLNEYDTETRYQATVVSSERITPAESDDEVRELVLEIGEGDFSFQVGQSVGVFAPGSPEFGTEHHFRLYSVADVPDAYRRRERPLPVLHFIPNMFTILGLCAGMTGIRFAMLMRELCERNGGAFVALNSLTP